MCDLHLEGTDRGGEKQPLYTTGISSPVNWSNTSEISVLSVRYQKASSIINTDQFVLDILTMSSDYCHVISCNFPPGS